MTNEAIDWKARYDAMLADVAKTVQCWDESRAARSGAIERLRGRLPKAAPPVPTPTEKSLPQSPEISVEELAKRLYAAHWGASGRGSWESSAYQDEWLRTAAEARKTLLGTASDLSPPDKSLHETIAGLREQLAAKDAEIERLRGVIDNCCKRGLASGGDMAAELRTLQMTLATSRYAAPATTKRESESRAETGNALSDDELADAIRLYIYPRGALWNDRFFWRRVAAKARELLTPRSVDWKKGICILEKYFGDIRAGDIAACWNELAQLLTPAAPAKEKP